MRPAAAGALVFVPAFVLAAAIASLVAAAGAGTPQWTEVKWPFLMDQWGTGRAFRCGAADCGVDVHIYLRAKVGFCNSATGVADDEELDRLADLDLLGANFTPMKPGRPVAVGWMKGRGRVFRIETGDRTGRAALAIALSNKSDAVIATVVADSIAPDIERAALEFLRGEAVLRWAEATTGLQ